MLKKLIKKRFKILAVLGIVLVLILTRKHPVKVEISKVAKGTITQAISASGKVEAKEKADLSFSGGGRVAWVGVKKGDSVSKWQGIASLDTVALNTTYQQALNTYRSLEAAAQKAEDDVKGHDADETFAQKSTRMAAQVARDNAFDAVKAAEQALKLAVVVAPFAGVVTEVNPAFAGVNVLPGVAVYSVLNPLTFYFSCEVGEADIAKIKPGQEAILRFDAYPDKDLKGKVKSIDLISVITSTGGTAYKTEISLPKAEGVELRLGLNGGVEIITGVSEEALYVPAEAVVETPDGSFVWKIENGNRVKKIKIETGVSSIEQMEIKNGLTEGDSVVVSPSEKLKNGDKIRI